ncbi:hypothetical protein K490DRAFT_68321 [Saccharata proteae CBS 121410]|uniref:DUF1769-domain-containing protein n=1 Tax=Saccharata proteae CBS 121410 TaxID=1314787 RepID=A0A9P4HSM6_9PEZI|nr:hypothetical protein K490DRAFT_68321 [Saccharata proteae CBS 121410]
MPLFRGIDVRIVTNDSSPDTPFEEYGTQARGSRRFVSTFIEARTGTCFKVCIKPTMPFPDPATGAPLNGAHPVITGEKVYYPHAHTKMDLMARVYLDESPREAYSIIVDLDPINPNDELIPKDGIYKMGFRCIDHGQVRFVPSQWVFRELGIESVLENLSLNDRANSGAHPAFEENSQEEERQSGAGQIKVIFQRIRCATTAYPQSALHSYKERDSSRTASGNGSNPSASSGDGAPQDKVTHFIDEKNNATADTTFINAYFNTVYVDALSQPFATFVFKYRKKAVLNKLRVMYRDQKGENIEEDGSDDEEDKFSSDKEVESDGEKEVESLVEKEDKSNGEKDDKMDDGESDIEFSDGEEPSTSVEGQRGSDSDDDRDKEVREAKKLMKAMKLRGKRQRDSVSDSDKDESDEVRAAKKLMKAMKTINIGLSNE